MGGWTSHDRDTVEWDGDVIVRNNLNANIGTFQRVNIEASAPFLTFKDTNSAGANAQTTIIFYDMNGASKGTFGYTVPGNSAFWVSNSSGNINLYPGTGYNVIIGSKQIKSVANPTDAQDAVTKAYSDSLSGALSSLSGALDYLNDTYQVTSGSHIALSGAHDLLFDDYQVTSGAYLTHSSDASDPHTSELTQTHLLLTSGACSGDVAASSAYIPNVLYGNTSGAFTASNYPIGTILFVYE